YLRRRAGAPSAVLPASRARLGEVRDARPRILSGRLWDTSGRRDHGRVRTAGRAAHPEGRQVSDPRYDAIVIGAGANGLVAAHYLARAGKRVVVFEQHQAPDLSADIGWVPTALIRDLGLGAGGLRIEEPDTWITVPLDAGGTLELSRDIGRSVEAIRRVSPADAAKWPDFCARMHTL